MAAVERSAKLLSLLSGTEALRELRAENRIRDLRRILASLEDVRANHSACASQNNETLSIWREALDGEIVLRSRLNHLAAAMNSGPRSGL